MVNMKNIIVVGKEKKQTKSPQIRLLYRISSKAAVSFTCDLHCKAIAVVFFLPCGGPI